MSPEVATLSPPLPRAEALQRNGRRLVVVGYGITVVGIVLYCMACLSGGFNADMGDLLLENAVPFGRATLALLGLGTVTWIVGSFACLRGAMEDGP
ncbi:MAG: hypothetical protein IT383_01985 [Deltaproteobacteria bacterium]|nr:hypothetical protein [Deltaproteobacteria bacterium]